MQTREREKESVNDFKTHAEIEELFNELKELEKRYSEYKDIKPGTREEFIEVGREQEKIEPIPIHKEKIEIKKIAENAEKKLLKKPIFNLKSKLGKVLAEKKTQKLVNEIKPTTFRLRLNEEGRLENIDIKKPKAIVKRKLKFSIKNRKKRKKEQKSTEEESRLDKFKGVFSKISKLKKVIPSKSTLPEETETPEEPEF